jgi:hypothetical protein
MPKNRRRHAGPSATERIRPEDMLDEALSGLWTAIAAGDLLRAEIEASAIMSLPGQAGSMSTDDSDAFIATLIVNLGRSRRTPDGAAFLRLLVSLGSPAVKRSASRALAELTKDGIYPLEWVAEAGRAAPGQTWRHHDIFGDDEAVVVTFSYGGIEHALVAQVDLTLLPVVTKLAVATDAAAVVEAMKGADQPFERSGQIGLAEARRRLEEPLARCDQKLIPGLDGPTASYLPFARSRVRRLPADGEKSPALTVADRVAAVDDFMASPQAAGCVKTDKGATRFWAEVLTGYNARIPGESLSRVGPRRLSLMLLSHVPNTFPLSPADREHMALAATAWTRWAAAREGLDEAATAHLEEHLRNVLADFDERYDDADRAAAREYLADLAAGDADAAWLAESHVRREFAMPFPEDRADDMLALLDATDPADRGAFAEAEFAGCAPPDGMSRKQFVAAAQRVIEQLWHDDPPATWQAAQRMIAEGKTRHDIIHLLAEKSPAD